MADAGGVRGTAVTLTLLFTDIERSTHLLQRLGEEAYDELLERHHDILRSAITTHGGTVRGIEGDSFFASFPVAGAAVDAAVTAQRQLAQATWPDAVDVRVRAGVHTGEVRQTDERLVGVTVHRAARIMSVAWGGQVLVSHATRTLLDDHEGDLSVRDLGEHRLRDLSVPIRLHQVTGDGLRATFPAPRSLDAVPNNLPTLVSSFVGREREVAQVARLLDDARLVTLTGPGGTGKTRLSLQVAAEVAGRFPGGVFFVALAPLRSDDLVPSAVAGALGLTPPSDRTVVDAVADHIADRHGLLVLDNFEHVLGAGAFVADLLRSTPQLRALVTSRSPLHLSGEQECPVPPLARPADGHGADPQALLDSEAGSLFAARAAAVQPGFEIDEGNAEHVAQIVQRLDGLPLAIELAAARIKLLPVSAIAQRLGSALDLLTAGPRDLPDRQRTLRGAIAWSYDLLDGDVQRLFERFSVFAGGADLDTVERVCGPGLAADVLGALGELVDHSLVRRLDTSDVARYVMLETIREFAGARLEERGEVRELRERHLETFLALAEEAAEQLTSHERGVWLRRLDREHDNLRASHGFAIADERVPAALRLVAALWRFWHSRGHLVEGSRVASQVLALPGVGEHRALSARALEGAGGVEYWRGDLEAARAYYRRSLEAFAAEGDEVAVARARYNLAFAHFERSSERRRLLEQALADFERLGDELGVAKAHWGLVVSCFWDEDFEGARRHAERCVPVFRRSDEPFDLAWALHMLGMAQFSLGDLDPARASFTESLELFRDADDLSAAHLVLNDFALLAEARDQPERALRLFGAVERLARDTGSDLLRMQRHVIPRSRKADESVGAERASALRDEGAAWSVREAVDYALGGT